MVELAAEKREYWVKLAFRAYPDRSRRASAKTVGILSIFLRRLQLAGIRFLDSFRHLFSRLVLRCEVG